MRTSQVDGDYFRNFCSEPTKFLFDRSDIKQWLETLRKSGVKVFALSNSLAEYAELMLETIFGSDWGSSFDLVLLHAKKPAFFTGNQAFQGLFSSIHHTLHLTEGDVAQRLSFLGRVTTRSLWSTRLWKPWKKARSTRVVAHQKLSAFLLLILKTSVPRSCMLETI